jgi:GntR family transcriptional regulator, trigonelline degradation regulator
MNQTAEDDVLRLVRTPVLVRELAADTLRQAILTGIFAPGERLVEATLAKRLGVSRPSVREALTQLAAEKLVTMMPNRGPAVAVIGWGEAQSIYEVRALLEAEAAAQFTERATKDDLLRMRRALRDFQRAIPKQDVGQLLLSTTEFYEVLLGHCGNPVIRDILGGLNARISVLRARSMSRPGRSKHSLSEMTWILETIEQKDAASAREASIRHVRSAAAAAREAFDKVSQASPASQADEG